MFEIVFDEDLYLTFIACREFQLEMKQKQLEMQSGIVRENFIKTANNLGNNMNWNKVLK